jgi:hypothetical protein
LWCCYLRGCGRETERLQVCHVLLHLLGKGPTLKRLQEFTRYSFRGPQTYSVTSLTESDVPPTTSLFLQSTQSPRHTFSLPTADRILLFVRRRLF